MDYQLYVNADKIPCVLYNSLNICIFCKKKGVNVKLNITSWGVYSVHGDLISHKNIRESMMEQANDPSSTTLMPEPKCHWEIHQWG